MRIKIFLHITDHIPFTCENRRNFLHAVVKDRNLCMTTKKYAKKILTSVIKKRHKEQKCAQRIYQQFTGKT